jgi:hypothetical protein
MLFGSSGMLCRVPGAVHRTARDELVADWLAPTTTEPSAFRAAAFDRFPPGRTPMLVML